VRVLFDQGTPEPLRHSLTQHETATAFERGWSKLKNGELLDAAKLKPSEFSLTVGRTLRRAGRRARETARMHATSIYISRNGKVVAVKP
jgi:hypothetical protein